MVKNTGLYYTAHPSALPVVGEHITVKTNDFDENQELPKGAVQVKVHYVSFDPYLRGRMRDPSIKSYSPPFNLGEPINNAGIVSVVRSNGSEYKEGDVLRVLHGCPMVEYAVIPAERLQAVQKLNNPYKLDEKIFLGALGMPGLTAYSSFYAIGEPKKGETIFISAASGAVGQLVGQLAKHEGLKVIGSVGDDKKLDFILKDLSFDAGFNYKKEKAHDALKRLAPDGIDIYYENVGGEQLEAALDALNSHGRVIACGMISQYNLAASDRYGLSNLMQIVAKRLKIQGFIVGDADMGPKYAHEHQEKVQKWIADGTFKVQQAITKGIENAGEGLLSVYEGKNFGKAVLEVAPLPNA
ncbi:hypothetical protein AMS68_002516 [Peltaster fructicola]|uniref:Enoyl reductase (ER) domain-containing protein n=1 Tax=Peltaster fructicola TaxID=286661 RepID=A0A6H0XQV4_9PEZI|nr:hypothetical protein AMS68_002516 [Peltaster fructicola]